MALRKSTRGTKKLAIIMKGFPPSISCLLEMTSCQPSNSQSKDTQKTRRHSATGTSNLVSHVSCLMSIQQDTIMNTPSTSNATRATSRDRIHVLVNLIPVPSINPCHINSPSTAKRESVNLQTTHSTAHSPTSSRAVLELRPNTFRSAFSFCTEKVKILIHFWLD